MLKGIIAEGQTGTPPLSMGYNIEFFMGSSLTKSQKLEAKKLRARQTQIAIEKQVQEKMKQKEEEEERERREEEAWDERIRIQREKMAQEFQNEMDQKRIKEVCIKITYVYYISFSFQHE